MLYIKVPINMVYKQVSYIDQQGNAQLEDRFVSKLYPEQSYISIQQAVYEFLKTHRSEANIDTLQIFKKKGIRWNNFLEYRPNRNGLDPSKHVKLLEGIPSVSTSPSSVAWFKTVPLSPERKYEIVKKYDEQRDNRRHIGDSPLPT